MALRIAPIPNADLGRHLTRLAELRIAVFRAWPYLYDGDMAYEERYLATLAESPNAVVVGAWDDGAAGGSGAGPAAGPGGGSGGGSGGEAGAGAGGPDPATLVGAATGAPMEEHADEFAAAFAGTGLALDRIFYCAESVLLPAYRGQGAGHAFFDHREAAARRLGRSHVAFCAVVRPEDHPARPAGHRPLDAFWRGRGYAPMPGVVARFPWRDIGDREETEKPLQFWIREL